MKFKIESLFLPWVRSFLSIIQYSPVVVLELGEKGLRFSVNDQTSYGDLTLPVMADEFGILPMSVDVLSRLVAEDQDISLDIQDGGVKVELGSTKLDLSLLAVDDAVPVNFGVDPKEFGISLSCLQNLVSDLAISKTPKSHFLNTMNFGATSIYAATNHMAMTKVPDLVNTGVDTVVTNEFFRHLNIMAKIKAPGYQIMLRDDMVGIRCEYFRVWTNRIEGGVLRSLEDILAAIPVVSVKIKSQEESERILQIMGRLSIPLIDFEDPVIQVNLTVGSMEFVVRDKNNRLSWDKIEVETANFPVDTEKIPIRLGLIDLVSVLSKKRDYPMTMSIHRRAVVFSNGKVNEFVMVYA